MEIQAVGGTPGAGGSDRDLCIHIRDADMGNPDDNRLGIVYYLNAVGGIYPYEGLSVFTSGVLADGPGNRDPNDPGLTWGAWYRLSIDANMLNGADNDVSVIRLFDASNTLLSTVTGGSWEANGAHGLSNLGFRGRNRGELALNSDFFFVDDLTVTVLPEPASLALAGLGGLLMLRRRRG